MRALPVAAVALVALAVLAAPGPATARAGWGPAFDVVRSTDASTGRSSAVVAAPRGRFVVAWTSRRAGVQARRIGPAGTGRVLTLDPRGADDVRLWSSPTGATVATWTRPGGALRLRSIGPDDRLGPATTITRSGEGIVAIPRRDGSTTVAWIARTGPQAALVQARRISAGGRPGPISVLTAAGDDARDLLGAPDIDDGAMLAWTTGGILYGRRVTPDGAPARPTFQISGLGETVTAPRLTTDGTGGATAVWVQGAAPTTVQQVAIISDDKLSGLDQLSAPGVTAMAPSLAFRGLQGIVVWEERRQRGSVVVGIDADGRRTTLSRPGAPGLRPHAAIDAAGHGFVVWQRGRAVEVARFGPTGRPRRTTLAAGPARAGGPHVAVTAGGRALAVWVRATRAGSRLQAARSPQRLAKHGSAR